jgi:secondary thiamine-phosphate synthase enzyme
MFRATLTVRTRAREELVDGPAEGRPARAAAVVCAPNSHTPAAVTVNENADPDVQTDMLAWLKRLIPEDPSFRHAEGNSDAHLKASLLGPSLQVPVVAGRMLLGTWQGIYFCEFDGPRVRALEVVGQ